MGRCVFSIRSLVWITTLAIISGYRSLHSCSTTPYLVNRYLRMSEQQPWVYDTSPKNAKQKAAFKNNVPFDDDVYETMKSSIELLTRRMKKREAGKDMSIDEANEATGGLTIEEAKWLSDAVEVLIEDAYKYGPPLRIPNIAPPPDASNTEEEI